MDITIGATLTGGTTLVLQPAGITPGKSVLAVTGSTRLEPKSVQFYAEAPVSKANDPGVAKTGMKVSLANRLTEEGCCTVAAGTVIIDVGVRWPLSQPETLVDEAVDILQGLVFSTEFISAIKAGILPQ